MFLILLCMNYLDKCKSISKNQSNILKTNLILTELQILNMITGVTTMLNFFTTSNGFRSTLPVVSNLTAMNVWDGVCMCFIYASLLEFVCVNYVGRKRPLHNVVYRPGENPVTQVRFFKFTYKRITFRWWRCSFRVVEETLLLKHR